MKKTKRARSGNLRNKKKLSHTLTISVAAVAVVLVAAVVAVLVLALRGQGNDFSDTGLAVIENKDDTETPIESNNEPEPEFTGEHAENIKVVRVEGEPEVEFVNRLTGEAVSEEIANRRPVAIMINNIRVACPQEGVSNADILYECVAEGGITRLLMIALDYESLDVVGSVRSSRKYYLDFAQNHDAVYVHAGGSDEAYSEILSRGINHLDGVRTDAASGIDLSGICFYRDSERRYSMGLEHSMMTTGTLIVEGISRMGYRTELKDGFEDPINIIPSGFKVELDGIDADSVKMTYMPNNSPEYKYDEASGDYLRWQYGAEHIDGTTGEQLAFTNVLLLVMDHANSGDSYGHMIIDTTGQGSGYYFTGGKMIEINWSCDDEDEAMVLTDGEGYPLLLNKGKTAINIISPVVEDTLVIG